MTVPTGNGESHGSLHDIFPGETITLSTGQSVTIRPWSAWDVIHRIPAKVGVIVSSVMPVFSGAGGDPEMMRARMPVALAAASGAIGDIVREETGLSEEDLKSLRGADLAKIARAIIEQNMDFFGEIDRLRGVLASRELTGPALRSY